MRGDVAWCWSESMVVVLLSVMGVADFAQNGILVAMAVYVTGGLSVPTMAFSTVLNIPGAGDMLGGALIPVADRKLGFSYVLPVGMALAGPLLPLMIASSNLALFADCLFFNPFFDIMVSVLVASLRQKIAPRELTDRVTNVRVSVVMEVAMPGSALLGGAAARLLGVRLVFIPSEALCLLSFPAVARNLHPRALR